MEIKVGDRVRFLNDVGGGVVTKIIDKMSVLVMNEFDFEVPAKIKELLVIEEDTQYAGSSNTVEIIPSDGGAETAESIENTPDLKEIFFPEVFIDDSAGDDLSVFLAFVPQERPGNSDLDVYLINDSNYNVLYSIVNVDEDGKTYSNTAGIIEANTKEQFETLGLNSVNEIPEYLFHLIFYRKGEFNVKQPVTKSIKINPVRFYKEKAYVENDFFNEDAIVFSIYSEKELQKNIENLTQKDLKEIIKKKEEKPEKKKLQSPKKPEKSLMEVDLHIHELLDDFRGLSNSGMLEIQMEHFKQKLDEAKNRRIKKVVFIHGVGEGKLKQELRRELDKMKTKLSYQDASYKEYGYGATMVIFRQFK
jgi:dsDNA-specific endonuclease/ATPase MutS2